MMIINKKINYFLKISLITLCLFLITVTAQCQTPQIDITLTWSTNTFVPLKYQGKPLPVRGSDVEVVANINNPGVNPEDLTYNWFLNDYFQEESSGFNKQVLKFNTGVTTNDKNIVRLEIKNSNGLFIGTTYLSIENYDPEIVIHSKDTSLKIDFLPLNKCEIGSNKEIQFIATPYFFNINNTNELDYKWEFDDQKTSVLDTNNPNKLLLKINEITESIKKNLKIFVENQNNRIQKAQKIIEITLTP